LETYPSSEGAWEPCVWGGQAGLSCLFGLSRMFRSLNKTDQMSQRNQMN
jgi:hypothetical protein